MIYGLPIFQETVIYDIYASWLQIMLRPPHRPSERSHLRSCGPVSQKVDIFPANQPSHWTETWGNCWELHLMGPNFSTCLGGMYSRFINTNLLSKWFCIVTSFRNPAQRDFMRHAVTLNSTWAYSKSKQLMVQKKNMQWIRLKMLEITCSFALLSSGSCGPRTSIRTCRHPASCSGWIGSPSEAHSARSSALSISALNRSMPGNTGVKCSIPGFTMIYLRLEEHQHNGTRFPKEHVLICLNMFCWWFWVALLNDQRQTMYINLMLWGFILPDHWCIQYRWPRWSHAQTWDEWSKH